MDTQNSVRVLDIRYVIYDILYLVFGYISFQLYLWISKNQIMDIQKDDFWIFKNLAELWIPIICLLDFHKLIFRYPQFDFWMSKIILDIHNYFL